MDLLGNFTAGFSVVPEAVSQGSDMATIVPYATSLVGGGKKKPLYWPNEEKYPPESPIKNILETNPPIFVLKNGREIQGRRLKRTKSTRIVKGAKFQSRPSASYYFNELKKPVGYKVSYRPRKGGKYILHSLRLRENGSPYWRPEEKLPKLSKKKTKKNKRTKRK